jgi:hypothetical protein
MRERQAFWEVKPVSNAMLVVHGAVVALSLCGVILLWLNESLISRSLYTYGIWAVPPLGAIAGLFLFGFVWGGRPIVRKLTEADHG